MWILLVVMLVNGGSQLIAFPFSDADSCLSVRDAIVSKANGNEEYGLPFGSSISLSQCVYIPFKPIKERV